jgi:hypothetical protein
VTNSTPTAYKLILSDRDSATVETRAKHEDSFLRMLNSYVQSMALRDQKFFTTMSAIQIEYLCQLAYEGKPVETPAQRSKELEQRIGTEAMAHIKTHGRGLINMFKGMNQVGRTDPLVRKTMTAELIFHYRNRIKRNEHLSVLGVRRKPYAHLDDEFFSIVIPRSTVKVLAWDAETQTSRFRTVVCSDLLKVEGINLTEGHYWKHLRLQTKKTWREEITDWNIVPFSARTLYLREQRR